MIAVWMMVLNLIKIEKIDVLSKEKVKFAKIARVNHNRESLYKYKILNYERSMKNREAKVIARSKLEFQSEAQQISLK